MLGISYSRRIFLFQGVDGQFCSNAACVFLKITARDGGEQGWCTALKTPSVTHGGKEEEAGSSGALACTC